MTSFMEGRRLKVTLVSAKNLPDIRSLGQMKVYAEVSLNGIPANAKTSEVDKRGKTNPQWNFVASFTVGEVAVQLPGVNLVVKLSCQRFRGAELIGEVKIPIKNLFDMAHEFKNLSYDVKGTPNGVLNISYSFGQKMAISTPAPAQKKSSSSGQKIVQGLGLGLGILGLAPGLFGGADDCDYEED